MGQHAARRIQGTRADSRFRRDRSPGYATCSSLIPSEANSCGGLPRRTNAYSVAHRCATISTSAILVDGNDSEITLRTLLANRAEFTRRTGGGPGGLLMKLRHTVELEYATRATLGRRQELPACRDGCEMTSPQWNHTHIRCSPKHTRREKAQLAAQLYVSQFCPLEELYRSHPV